MFTFQAGIYKTKKKKQNKHNIDKRLHIKISLGLISALASLWLFILIVWNRFSKVHVYHLAQSSSNEEMIIKV